MEWTNILICNHISPCVGCMFFGKVIHQSECSNAAQYMYRHTSACLRCMETISIPFSFFAACHWSLSKSPQFMLSQCIHTGGIIVHNYTVLVNNTMYLFWWIFLGTICNRLLLAVSALCVCLVIFLFKYLMKKRPMVSFGYGSHVFCNFSTVKPVFFLANFFLSMDMCSLIPTDNTVSASSFLFDEKVSSNSFYFFATKKIA